MAKFFRVSYEIVTPESVSQGDVAERGFALPGGWRTPIESARSEPDAAFNMTLCEAERISHYHEDSGSWLSSYPATLSYRDGSEVTYSLHPPRNVTGASYKRIKRALGIK